MVLEQVKQKIHYLRRLLKNQYVITYRVGEWNIESAYSIDTRASNVAELIEYVKSKHPDRIYLLIDFIYCE